MDPALFFGFRNALDAMNPAFVFKRAIRALAFNRKNNFFKSADIGAAGRHDICLPSFALGITRVHTKKLGGKKRGPPPPPAGPAVPPYFCFFSWGGGGG